MADPALHLTLQPLNVDLAPNVAETALTNSVCPRVTTGT